MIFTREIIHLTTQWIVHLHDQRMTTAEHVLMIHQTMMTIYIRTLRIHHRIHRERHQRLRHRHAHHHHRHNLTSIRMYHHSIRVLLHLQGEETILHLNLYHHIATHHGKTLRIAFVHENGYNNGTNLSLSLYHRRLDPEGRTLDNGVFRTTTMVMSLPLRHGVNRTEISAVISVKKHKRVNHHQTMLNREQSHQ